jgi:outer membrane biogenesis lipoprotein LolB
MRALIPVALLLLAACAQDEPPPPPKEPQGRAETRSIRNTDAIGYQGSQIADKVDATLDANDQRIRQNDEAANP